VVSGQFKQMIFSDVFDMSDHYRIANIHQVSAED
jgi:hypothetical protein